MTSESSVAIVMATYNGEKYLKNQIESILKQTYLNWTLYIGDDGSTDSTKTIIDYYAINYTNIVKVDTGTQNLGAKRRFMTLLESVQADYYMFSDQDDVWLENKIEISLNKIKSEETANPNRPVVVHTDLIVTDENLSHIHESFWKRSKIKPDVLNNVNYLGVFNCATGCTMIFNNHAKNVSLPMPDVAPMHDWWVTINTAKNGIIATVETPTILYRQHLSNVVGAREISSMYFIKKLIHIFSTLKGHQELFPFHKFINYGPVTKYYYYKVLYTIKRNF